MLEIAAGVVLAIVILWFAPVLIAGSAILLVLAITLVVAG